MRRIGLALVFAFNLILAPLAGEAAADGEGLPRRRVGVVKLHPRQHR